jgi:hypothetical protein
MENKIKALIQELYLENKERSDKMNGKNGLKLSQREHSVFVHSYNLTLDFIRKLEKLIN